MNIAPFIQSFSMMQLQVTSSILDEIEPYALFTFVANGASSGSSSVLYATKPNDRLNDFTFARGSTATYINSNGTMVTQTTSHPRIDYLRGVPELLLEYTATNYITYSNNFTASIWTNTNTTETADTVNSVDGTQNATTVTQSSTTSQVHSLDLTLVTNSVNGSFYTYSIFVKAGANIDWVKLEMSSTAFGDTNGVWFNISNGTIGTVESGMHLYKLETYSNGWYRCSISRKATAAAALTAKVILCSANNSTTMNGSTSNYIYVSKADYTNINHISSHIPTNGATVTRSSDTAYGAGNSSLINSQAGVIFAEISTLAPNIEYEFGGSRTVSISDGTSANFVCLYWGNISESADNFSATSRGNAVTLGITPTYTASYDNVMKVALKYESGSCQVYIDGTLRGTDTTFTPHTSGSLTKVSFDRYWGDPFRGRCRQFKLFDRVLTSEQLIALTSW